MTYCISSDGRLGNTIPLCKPPMTHFWVGNVQNLCFSPVNLAHVQLYDIVRFFLKIGSVLVAFLYLTHIHSQDKKLGLTT